MFKCHFKPSSLIALCALSTFVAGCGLELQENPNGSFCTILLNKGVAEPIPGTLNVRQRYQGDLSQDCLKKLNGEDEGNIHVSIIAESNRIAGTSLELVSAGQSRQYFLPPQGRSFEKGTVEASFSSTTNQDWKLPWSDVPKTAYAFVITPQLASQSTAPIIRIEIRKATN